MHIPETPAAIQTTMVACHQDSPAPTILEPKVLRRVSLHASHSESQDALNIYSPVPETDSEPEQTEVIPPPVLHVRRRRLQVFVSPGVTSCCIPFSMDILEKRVFRSKGESYATRPRKDRLLDGDKWGIRHGGPRCVRMSATPSTANCSVFKERPSIPSWDKR